MINVSMKYERMSRIEEKSELAMLFNYAMTSLERSRIISAPVDFDCTERFHYPQFLFYESCLWELYMHGVVSKLKEWKEYVDEYLKEYQGNWKYYASSRRLSSLKEYGAEPCDLDENGEIRIEGLTETELKPYTLKSDLEECMRHAALSAYPENLENMYLFILSSSRVSIFDIFNKMGKHIPQYKQDEDGNMVEMTFAEIAQSKAENEMTADDMVKMLVAVAYEFRSLIDFTQTVPAFENYEEELVEFRKDIDKLIHLDFKMPRRAEEFYQRIIKKSENSK